MATAVDPAIEQTFRALVERWRRETQFTSSVQMMVMHPAYQRIIGLGPVALPLLLRELEATFPNLVHDEYQIRSEATPRYNCVGWALGDTMRWWWPIDRPTAAVNWPAGVRAEPTLAAFVEAFASLGFEVCDTAEPESGAEKVVLYLDAAGVPTHVARQLPSGRWTSKLGRSVDIEHGSPSALEGDVYGTIGQYFKRART